MIKITAVVRANKTKAVAHALKEAGAPGFTYYSVKGHGRESITKPRVNQAASAEFGPFPTTIVEEVLAPQEIVADVLPRIEFEIVCSEDTCEKVVAAVRKASITGEKGDGIIYIQPVSKSIRIISDS